MIALHYVIFCLRAVSGLRDDEIGRSFYNIKSILIHSF